MSRGIEVNISSDNTQNVLDALKSAIETSLEAVGLAAEGYAKGACPVDTGTLRDSITHTVDGNDAYIGTNVEYAPYVEFGTSRMKAQEFLRPAAQDHASEYSEIFRNNLSN